MKKPNTTKQINRAYQSRMKALLKGKHESEIFDSLKNGKNSYLRLDRLASSSFDRSWIDIIEDVIFDLGAIIANPRSTTKVEGSITPVELARKITSESVQHLASHTQYIKEVDEYGNVIPSKLLSMYADDDLHTYENRFIATFVRRLMLFISKRYEYITKYAELRNEEVLFFKNYSVVDGADVEIETKIKVSYKNEDEEAVRNSKYIDRIIQTRQYILYFYNSPFMKALKNEKDVRNPIIQTNIIRKNPKYHHCYEVYRFIESYDKLGVNYKIDENYSLFNSDELNELNRTLFANYITLKGNSESKSSKKNTKVYKPKILTSMDDESFIYGPLFEGPIEFVRIDDTYQQYLDSKVKKDLPLHPTKKEKEYYKVEYEKKSENKQDLKQKNDLIKRTEKQVTQFEKKVKGILAKREEARLKLIELEKQTIKQEETDLLEAARREIIEASKKDVVDTLNDQAEKKKAKAPVIKEIKYEDALNEVFPQLDNPVVLEQPKVEEPVKEEPVVVVKEEEPVKEQPKELVPTVSFEDAANEIWPQLNKPRKLAKKAPKEEKKEKSQPKVEKKKPEAKLKENKPAKKAEPKKAEPKKEKPAKNAEPKKEVKKTEAKKEAPKKKEEPKKAPENKPAPKKEEAKPAPAPVKRPKGKKERKAKEPKQVQPVNKIKAKHSRKGFRK